MQPRLNAVGFPAKGLPEEPIRITVVSPTASPANLLRHSVIRIGIKKLAQNLGSTPQLRARIPEKQPILSGFLSCGLSRKGGKLAGQKVVDPLVRTQPAAGKSWQINAGRIQSNAEPQRLYGTSKNDCPGVVG
jgi:hypothetical protein